MIKATTLLLTGQIRTPVQFMKTVSTAVELRYKGFLNECILSVWTGEIDRHEGLRRYLNEVDFQIVETPEPQQKTKGNIWHQMIGFAAGLIRVATPYVLKSRPDVFIAEKVIRRLVTSPDLRTDPFKTLAPFTDRIWVPWMEISRPFFLADECFYAALPDAWLLHNMDLSYDRWDIKHGISHIRRFMHPFRHHDEANMFLSRFTQAAYDTDDRYPRLQRWLLDPDYTRILAWYYAIVRRCFDVRTEQGDVGFRPWSLPNIMPRPGELPLLLHFSECMECPQHKHHLFCYDDAFINAIAEGKYNESELGVRLSDAIAHFDMSFKLSIAS